MKCTAELSWVVLHYEISYIASHVSSVPLSCSLVQGWSRMGWAGLGSA